MENSTTFTTTSGLYNDYLTSSAAAYTTTPAPLAMTTPNLSLENPPFLWFLNLSGPNATEIWLECGLDARLPTNLLFGMNNVVKVVSFAVLFLISLAGNVTLFVILSLSVLRKNDRVQRMLLHMNVADLIVTLYHMPKEIAHSLTIRFLGPEWLCKTCKFMDVFGVYLGSNVLVAITIDRFCCIMFPTYVARADRAVNVALVAAWIVAGILSLPQFYLFTIATHPCYTKFSQCIARSYVDSSIPVWLDLLNTIITSFEVYVLPFVVICVCYSVMCLKLASDHSNEEDSQSIIDSDILINNNNNNNGDRHEGASFKNLSSMTTGSSRSNGKPPLEPVVSNNWNKDREIVVYRWSQQQHQRSGTTNETASSNCHHNPGRRYSGTTTVLQNRRKSASSDSPATAAAAAHQHINYQVNLTQQQRRSSSGAASNVKSQSKNFHMTAAMVIVFLICWTPYFVSATLHFMDLNFTTGRPNGNIIVPAIVQNILNIFATLNSCANPYLYGYFSIKLRKEVRRVVERVISDPCPHHAHHDHPLVAANNNNHRNHINNNNHGEPSAKGATKGSLITTNCCQHPNSVGPHPAVGVSGKHFQHQNMHFFTTTTTTTTNTSPKPQPRRPRRLSDDGYGSIQELVDNNTGCSANGARAGGNQQTNNNKSITTTTTTTPKKVSSSAAAASSASYNPKTAAVEEFVGSSSSNSSSQEEVKITMTDRRRRLAAAAAAAASLLHPADEVENEGWVTERREEISRQKSSILMNVSC